MTAGQRVFVAATGQNRGKTTASLGLTAAIIRRGSKTGFIKPVGQRYLVVEGTRADEDAVLMKAVFDLPDALDDMSPVTLPRHFTTDYIMGRIEGDLERDVTEAASRVAKDKDLLVIEGTGHAGVGAVVGLSNARVAALLEAPVVIVSEGGVGRPIDEIVLNHALFERDGVRVVGAVVNKVDVESHPDLPDILRRGLAQHGIDLLGCIPYSDLLANPSLELIATHLDGELLAGQATPGRTIGHVAIGAMQAKHAAGFIRDRTLLITPGDRDDMIEMALELNASAEGQVTGLVLTGGFRPPDAMLADLRAASLFTYLVRSDTYGTAQAVDEILVKTHPTDTEKIETIVRLVDGSLDIGDFLARLQPPRMRGSMPRMTATQPVVDRLHFTGNDEADRLLASEPLALLIGFALDQQVSVQKAFSGPAELRRRIGHLDAARIAAMDPEALQAAFRQRPALHRFPGAMAGRVQALCAHLVEHYGGDANRVWTDARDGHDLQARLLALPSIGDMKARSLISILAKRFGLSLPGLDEVMPTHPTLGDVDSAEALASYQAGKRAWKAAHRAAKG